MATSSTKTPQEILKAALTQYCNIQADLHELKLFKAQTLKPETDHFNHLKKQVHDYMKEQHVECLVDEHTGLFVYRASRKTPRPLTIDLEEIIVDEIRKAEASGQIAGGTDITELVQTVIKLVQEIRSTTTESLKIVEKQPPSIKTCMSPVVKEVKELLASFCAYHIKQKKINQTLKHTTSEINEKLKQVLPTVQQYCSKKGIIKKPVTFRRNWSSAFSSCVTSFHPTYFDKPHPAKSQAYLQYKKTVVRKREIKSLRPSKKYMQEMLCNLSTTKSSWRPSELAKALFKTLREEAEQKMITKLETAETEPVFKVSLGMNKPDNEDSD